MIKVKKEKMKNKLLNIFIESEIVDNFYEFIKKYPTLTPIIVSVVTTIIMRVLFEIFF